MSRKHTSTNIGSVGQFVNAIVLVAALALVGVGYFSAIGQFALVA